MGEVGSLRRLDADAGLAPVPPLRVVPGGESSVSQLSCRLRALYPSTASFRHTRIPVHQRGIALLPPTRYDGKPACWELGRVSSRDRT